MNHTALPDPAASSAAVRNGCLACLLALLTACGGGDDADYAQPDKTIGPPDCVNRPELCQ